jgi:sulfide:quinone oxidoreductase
MTIAATADDKFDIVVIGAGAGGISVSNSLLKRDGKLRIAIVDPATEHYYQPGWTMVGGGVFRAPQTRRQTRDLMPSKATWIQQAATGFAPDSNAVVLDNGRCLGYRQLIVAPGLKLNWDGIEGLSETLGKNGVTSNYRFDLAPYTWELVKGLKQGRAVFTQPAMPIKCAGAPQKALYLSADHWLKAGALKDIDIDFYNAGGVLFGVADYVPALQSYVDKYRARVHFNRNLVKIDGPARRAWFRHVDAQGEELLSEVSFDMIHVCPPQCAPDFIRNSALADAGGWLDVDQYTLRHRRFDNIWGLGDVMNTPNAKTMAAVRKQVPVVAQNVVDSLAGREPGYGYDGYGSCPLTVERGKIVLAEFGYGGKLLPTFPEWALQGKQPTRLAWFLKTRVLPDVYWYGMLKGHEWLVAPQKLQVVNGEAVKAG